MIGKWMHDDRLRSWLPATQSKTCHLHAHIIRTPYCHCDGRFIGTDFPWPTAIWNLLTLFSNVSLKIEAVACWYSFRPGFMKESNASYVWRIDLFFKIIFNSVSSTLSPFVDSEGYCRWEIIMQSTLSTSEYLLNSSDKESKTHIFSGLHVAFTDQTMSE